MKQLIFGLYCGMLGYQVHKREIDVKVLRKLNDGFDSLARRNAKIWSEELETVKLGINSHVGSDTGRDVPALPGDDSPVRMTFAEADRIARDGSA
jgi:hypothetical protein